MSFIANPRLMRLDKVKFQTQPILIKVRFTSTKINKSETFIVREEISIQVRIKEGGLILIKAFPSCLV